MQPGNPASPASLTPVSGLTTWLLALVMVFVAGLALAGAAALMAMDAGLPADAAIRLLFDPRSSPLLTNPAWIALTIVVNELGIALAFWIALRRLRLRLRQVVSLTRPSIAESLGALLLVFGVAPLAELCAYLVDRYVSADLTSEQMVQTLARGSSSAGFVIVLLTASLLPALVEESLFRGLLFRAFERYGGLFAVAITSLLFGALHLNPSQALLGLGFGVARWQTRSLTPSLLAHALYNAAVMIAERFAPSVAPQAVSVLQITVGVLAACFGWWLLGDRRSR